MTLGIYARLHRGHRTNDGLCACEPLEARRLLATFVHTVTSGHDVVYLTAGNLPGQVDVRLDSETGPFDHRFTNQIGLDVIQAPSGATVTFIDRVKASLKPTVDPNATGDPFGIKVQGGTNGTLKIDEKGSVDSLPGNVDDTLIDVIDADSTSATVRVTDRNNQMGYTQFGSGIKNLFVRTNDVLATDYHSFGGDGTDVNVPALAATIHLTVETGRGTYDVITLGTMQEPGPGHIEGVVGAVIHTGAGHCKVNMITDGDDQSTATVDFGPGTGTGTGLGLGNELYVDDAATAFLAQTGGANHVIVVDAVLALGGTVQVDEPTTIGDLQVEESNLHRPLGLFGEAIIAASSTIPQGHVNLNCTFSVEASSTIGTMVVNGTADFTAGSTVDQFPGSSGTVNVIGGALIIANQSAPHPADIRNLNVIGSTSSVLFKGTGSQVENLTVTDGGLATLEARDTGGTARHLWVNTVNLGSQSSPTGKLDLKDGGLIMEYSGTSPHDYIKAVITSAYAGGAWTGNGIGSSTAAGMTNTGVGYAEATEIFSEFPATFFGRAVDNTSVLVRYTYYGDVNLNGYVNLADFNKLTSTFGQPNRLWVHGDSTYDGQVLLADFNKLANNIGLPSFGPEDEGGDGDGDGLRGGEPQYTYDELLAILMQMYPQYF
jgi:hypothetical protein